MDMLRGHRQAALAPPVAIDPHAKKVLLIYTYSTMGQALLLAPLVQAVVKVGAQTPIGLLLRPEAARIWKQVDLPVRVHVVDDGLLCAKGHCAAAEGFSAQMEAERLRLAVGLKRRNYHLVGDVSPGSPFDVRFWMEASAAPLRLGFLRANEKKASELTWGVPPITQPENEHWVHFISTALRSLGLGRLSDRVPFTMTDSARTKGEGLWGSSPRVLIIPGYRRPESRLAPRCFVVAGQRATRQGGSVVIAGAPDERAELKALAHEIGPGSTIYAGKALGSLVALIRSADLVVTRDTGPMQVAFLTGARTLAFFTSRKPLVWGPMRPCARYSLLNIPPETADAAGPVIERLILQRVDLHLTQVMK